MQWQGALNPPFGTAVIAGDGLGAVDVTVILPHDGEPAHSG